jgi:hypothetical protein
VNGFIDHLYTQLGITINYRATADLHNLQITTAPAKPFLVYVFTSRSLTTDSNSGDSSASRRQVLSSEPPLQNSLKSDNFIPCLYHLGTDHCCSPTVALLRICCLASEKCLPSRCPETVAVYESLLSNGSIRHNIYQTTRHHSSLSVGASRAVPAVGRGRLHIGKMYDRVQGTWRPNIICAYTSQ